MTLLSINKTKTDFEKSVKSAFDLYKRRMHDFVIDDKGESLVTPEGRKRLEKGFDQVRRRMDKAWTDWNAIVNQEISVVLTESKK